MTSEELRKLFLDFFASHGHAILPSASLIPEHDPTTLFTGSGMQPMIPYLLGEKHPLGVRLTDSQKCFRTQDIDEVGDNSHTTFFEMLGNWSLGDYFKKEQIAWMFQFLVEELKLDPKRIYITVFRGNDEIGLPRDEEAVRLWQETFAQHNIEATAVDFSERDGMQDGRIFYYNEEKNWWSRSGVPQAMPVGEPGGPDSEMFWDFGVERQLHEQSLWKDQPCHVNCDCGRFMEIGNNVFMQYQKTATGFTKLKQNNVDFGGGLERITAAKNENPDIFQLDLFFKAKEEIKRLSGKRYNEADEATQKAYRVILDHLRAASMLIADSALPSNKDQGYFVRRLIRRAVRFGSQLGIIQPFSHTVGGLLLDQYVDSYPEMHERKKEVLSELEKEEIRFRKTLEQGLKQFAKVTPVDSTITDVDAFDLFTTYGFPIEITIELAAEKGLAVDEAGFRKRLAKHQQLSRTASAGKFKGGLADASEQTVRYHTATHLLHQALRTVLGSDVRQRGSNITPERLRFDFSFPRKMTKEEVQAVQNMVNEQIAHKLPVTSKEVTPEEAKQDGALGFFEHKYGDRVKVYTIGDFSKEICGGPHVKNTEELASQTFTIIKEEAVSAGVRRIKAILS